MGYGRAVPIDPDAEALSTTINGHLQALTQDAVVSHTTYCALLHNTCLLTHRHRGASSQLLGRRHQSRTAGSDQGTCIMTRWWMSNVLQEHLLSVKQRMLAALDAAVTNENGVGSAKLQAKQVSHAAQHFI